MLKKMYFSLLAIFLTGCLFLLSSPSAFYLFNKKSTVFVGSSSSECILIESFRQQIINGKKGESVKITTQEFNLEQIIKYFDAQLILKEQVGGIVNYYFYSKKLRYKERIYGKTVNLHIAVTNQGVTLGTPLIYGWY